MIHYPFAALVGQEQLKTALLLNAIDPGIGGVLVCGEKGTAKSTAGRALADLLPPIAAVQGCPFNSPPGDPFYGLGADGVLDWRGRRGGSSRSERPASGGGRRVNGAGQAEEVEQAGPAGASGEQSPSNRGHNSAGVGDEPPGAVEIPVPFVDLPLGATEDRVLGTLDIQRALRDGEPAFRPGLLAQANRGIVYIDEVNLLPDHLVDLLLDAAAMGVNTVQREGIEFMHPARFLLIGTMNPEEGELRPQFLDRFGLMVQVDGPTDPQTRVEVVRRRADFESDPAAFLARWQPSQTELQNTITAARRLLPDVQTGDDTLLRISEICCDVGVSGMRADIVMHRTSRALAALTGRTSVQDEDLRQAAELVLPHRRRRQPFERPGWDPDQFDDLLSSGEDKSDQPAGQDARPNRQDESPSSRSSSDDRSSDDESSDDLSSDDRSSKEQSSEEQTPEEQSVKGSRTSSPSGGSTGQDSVDQSAEVSPNRPEHDDGSAAPVLETFSAQAPGRIQPIEVPVETPREHRQPGRRNKSASRGAGRHVRSVRDDSPTELAVDATVRAAAARGLNDSGRLEIQSSDLHRKERAGSAETLILFVVDASGSMAARRRMEAVKGAVLSLLIDAYQQRDRVGVIAFRGRQAELLLAPTSSVERAERTLQSMPTGGRTPLAHALTLASETVRQARRRDPEQIVLTVLLTDGKANVTLPGSTGEPWNQTLQAADALATESRHTLLLDTDTGFVRLNRTRVLAETLSAEYRMLDELSAESLAREVRQRTGAASGASTSGASTSGAPTSGASTASILSSPEAFLSGDST